MRTGSGPSASDGYGLRWPRPLPTGQVLSIEIQPSAVHGLGVFLREAANEGQAICRIEGPLMYDVGMSPGEPDRWPNLVGLGCNVWINPLPPLSHLNHSCEPAARIGYGRMLYALRPLPAGAEITIDYSTTELDPLWHMECACGAMSCRRTIRAIQFMPDNLAFAPPGIRRAVKYRTDT
jgi:hypothetical protein